jgi:hypothetical protein
VQHGRRARPLPRRAGERTPARLGDRRVERDKKGLSRITARAASSTSAYSSSPSSRTIRRRGGSPFSAATACSSVWTELVRARA